LVVVQCTEGRGDRLWRKPWKWVVGAGPQGEREGREGGKGEREGGQGREGREGRRDGKRGTF